MSVSADKGFTYWVLDDAFVCQKKNHFQVSLNVNPLSFREPPKYVISKQGPKAIAHFQVNVYGLKTNPPFAKVGIEQSLVSRSKVPFEPLKIELGKKKTKVQVCVCVVCAECGPPVPCRQFLLVPGTPLRSVDPPVFHR